MKRVALDTNIVIEILNQNHETIEGLGKFQIFYLPVTVVGELMYGAFNSQKRSSNERLLKSFIKSCKIYNATTLDAVEYANIRLGLKQKGKPIPENDIWIASICKTNNIALATRDAHFKNIEDLKVVGF